MAVADFDGNGFADIYCGKPGSYEILMNIGTPCKSIVFAFINFKTSSY